MSNSYAINSSNFEVINTNDNVYTQSPNLEGNSSSVNSDVEEFDFTGKVSGSEATDVSDSKFSLYADLTEEDITSLVGTMSQEEYKNFIDGMKEYNQYERDYLQTLLDGKDGQPGVTFYKEDLVFDWDWEPQWHNKNMFYAGVEFRPMLDMEGNEFRVEDYLGLDWAKFKEMSYEEQIDFLENSKAFDKYFGFSYDEFLERKESGNESIDDIINSIDYNNPDFSVAPGDDTFLRGIIRFEEYREQLLDVVKEDYEKELEWSKEAVEDYGEEYGCKNIAELYATKEQLKATEKEIKDSMSMLDNKINSMEYDNLYYLKDYQDFSMRTEFSEEEIEQYFEFARDTSTWYTPADYIALHPEYSEAEVIFLHQQAMGDLGGFLLVDNTDYVLKFLNLYKSHPQYLKTLLYLQKYDPDAVYDYLDKIDYQLNQVYGEYEAQEFLSKLGYGDEDEYSTLEKIANELQVDLQGLLDGLDSFADGVGYTVEAIWTFFFGGEEDENRTYSVDDYKKMYILQALLSEEEKEKAGLIVKDPNTGEYVNANPNSLINYTISYSSFGSGLSSNYEVSQGIGNMIPSIALSAVNPFAGSLALGISAGGNSYHQAMVEGHSFMSSVLYGLFSGTSETVTERLFGGLPLLSDVKITGVSSYLASMGKEAFQEGVQELMDMGFCAWKWGEKLDANEIINRVSKSAFYGGITAGILNVPRLASAMDAKIAARKMNVKINQDSNISNNNSTGKESTDTKSSVKESEVQTTDVKTESTNTAEQTSAIEDSKVSETSSLDTRTDTAVEQNVNTVEDMKVSPPQLSTDTTGPSASEQIENIVLVPASVASLQSDVTTNTSDDSLTSINISDSSIDTLSTNVDTEFDGSSIDPTTDVSTTTNTTVTPETEVMSKYSLSEEQAETFVKNMNKAGLDEHAYVEHLKSKVSFNNCEDVGLMLEVSEIMDSYGITSLRDENGYIIRGQFSTIYNSLSSIELKENFYIEVVVAQSNSSEWGLATYIAAQQYTAKTGNDFYELSVGEQSKLIDEAHDVTLKTLDEFDKKQYQDGYKLERQKVADGTITRLKWMEGQGFFKEGYTYDKVLSYILSEMSPEVYLTEEYVANWKSKWNADANGNAKVVFFQSADVGAPGITKFGASVGRAGEGAFAMPYDEYIEILNAGEDKLPDGRVIPPTRNADGTINTAALRYRLGGVNIGLSPVAVVQTVNINDITLPTGSLDGSFVGEFVPGGQISSGYYDSNNQLVGSTVEGLIPATNLFNADGTLNENVTLELLTPEQQADYIHRAAESKFYNAIRNTEFDLSPKSKRNKLNADGISSLAAAVAAYEQNGIDIPANVEEYINEWRTKINDPKLSNSEILDMAAIASDITSNTSVGEDKAIKIASLFTEGMDAAAGKYNGFFKTFREHAVKHSIYVTKYAVKIASTIPGVNVAEVEYAALCHDLGMKGGIYAVYDKRGRLVGFKEIDSGVDLDNLTGAESFNIANKTRSNHPLNSALYVLTSDIVPSGMDADVIALLAMSHSKSTSGVKHFSSQQEWLGAIDKLDAAINMYNQYAGTDFKFDAERLRNMVNDPAQFKRLANEALAIRDGDAMSEVAYRDESLYKDKSGDVFVNNEKQDMIMQSGTSSRILYGNPSSDYNSTVANNFKDELKNYQIKDVVTQADGSKTQLNPSDKGEAISMKIHTGEQNVAFDSNYDGKKYEARASFVDARQAPNCTFDAIVERIGEVATYDNCDSRSFEIELPKVAEGTNVGNWYQEKLDGFKAAKRSEASAKYDAAMAEQNAATTAFKKGEISETEYQVRVENAWAKAELAMKDMEFYDGSGTTGAIRIVFK